MRLVSDLRVKSNCSVRRSKKLKQKAKGEAILRVGERVSKTSGTKAACKLPAAAECKYIIYRWRNNNEKGTRCECLCCADKLGKSCAAAAESARAREQLIRWSSWALPLSTHRVCLRDQSE
jgi:hypothetical protein